MENLIDAVLEQIEQDVKCGDVRAIETLLQGVCIKDLIDFLPEDFQNRFKYLRK